MSDTPTTKVMCSFCGADTGKSSESVPACHRKRLSCINCKKQARDRARAAWAERNPDAEKAQRARLFARKHERVRAETRARASNKGLRWTAAEDARLVEALSCGSYRSAAREMRRSLSSVEVRIWRIRNGLAKGEGPTLLPGPGENNHYPSVPLYHEAEDLKKSQ